MDFYSVGSLVLVRPWTVLSSGGAEFLEISEADDRGFALSVAGEDKAASQQVRALDQLRELVARNV